MKTDSNIDNYAFTIVTPNYNMGKYLKSTMDSVICNLGPGDEYFVIDGNSSDNSLELIRSYDNKLSGWISEPDNGYADALYKGFTMSSAPLMCWINSGDCLLNGTLDIVRKEFARSDADFLFGDDYYIDETGLVLQHTCGYAANLKHMMLYGGWTPLQDACFWRRSLYELAGGLNRDLRFAADFDLFLKMSIKGQCRYFPSVLSAFRRHDAQKSISCSRQYEMERYSIRKNAMIKMADKNDKFKTYLKRTLYGINVRLRCRIKFINLRSSKYIGKNIDQLKAGYFYEK